MTDKQLKQIYSAYFPYDLEMAYVVRDSVEKIGILETINYNESETHPLRLGIENMYDMEHEWMLKPFLYSVEMINREIFYKGEVFVPSEFFELGDDDSFNIDFGNKNIDLVKTLESIGKYNNYFDIQFLPFEVVQQLLKWKINIFNLPKDRYINYENNK